MHVTRLKVVERNLKSNLSCASWMFWKKIELKETTIQLSSELRISNVFKDDFIDEWNMLKSRSPIARV